MKISISNCLLLSSLFLLTGNILDAQEPKSVFKWFAPFEHEGVSFTTPLRFYEVLNTRSGSIKITSTLGVWTYTGKNVEIDFYTYGNDKKLVRSYNNEDGIRSMYESPDQLVFFASHDNKIFWQPSDQSGVGCPPFIFPPGKQAKISISKIWIDAENNMFIGTYNDNFYFVNEGAKFSGFEGGGMDSAGNFYITKGAKRVKKIVLGSNVGVYSFASDPVDKNRILIGTNKGLFFYRKDQENATNILPASFFSGITITHLEADEKRNIWFSTLEKGMGYYDAFSKTCQFFSYNKKTRNSNSFVNYSIETFCRKSQNEFFVAVRDSVPAIFNTKAKTYSFIQDSIFKKTKDSTTDIKLDGFGNLFVIKGGSLYYSNAFKVNKDYAIVKLESSAFAPFITNILISGNPYKGTDATRNLKEIRLKHFENNIQIEYSLAEYWEPDNVQFAWKAEGYMNEWVEMPIKGKEAGFAFLGPLEPGKYIFRMKTKVGNEDWRKQQTQLIIIIDPPFWETWWFWLSIVAGIGLIALAVIKWRVNVVRKQERVKAKYEKEALELEAKALRAQMNPHFIFNCMNSIKSLMQKNDQERGIIYLTTFSKLLRTIFQNADKREITLFDEIETCRLYTQLESMRFGKKFFYHFNIDETIDLKSVQVPALIIQPFIENAIWHGIMPKEEGGTLTVTITKNKDAIFCIIDDDGIGREISKQNKFSGESSSHQSKGVRLTQSRLDLNNTMNQKNASIEIVDKTNGKDESAGTKVTLIFNKD